MASLVAGVLAERDIVYPFYVFAAVILVSLGLGLLIGGKRLRIHQGSSAALPAEVPAT